jgi:hypothetical protein
MTEQIDVDLPSDPPVLHFAKRQDVVVFPMSTLRNGELGIQN